VRTSQPDHMHGDQACKSLSFAALLNFNPIQF
jgi:hypothetical protein